MPDLWHYYASSQGWDPGPDAKWSRGERAVAPPDQPIRVRVNGRVYWLDREARPPVRRPAWRRFLLWAAAWLRK